LSVFLNSLRDKKNNVIPVIFRPYHEMNDSWFFGREPIIAIQKRIKAVVRNPATSSREWSA
jgi:hypothetical protein